MDHGSARRNGERGGGGVAVCWGHTLGTAGGSARGIHTGCQELGMSGGAPHTADANKLTVGIHVSVVFADV